MFVPDMTQMARTLKMKCNLEKSLWDTIDFCIKYDTINYYVCC